MTFPKERRMGVATIVVFLGIAKTGQTKSRRTMRYAYKRRWSATKYPTSHPVFVKARRAAAAVFAVVWRAHMRYTTANAFPLSKSGTRPIHFGLLFFVLGSAWKRLVVQGVSSPTPA
jgi:hypothetical protein